MSYIKRIFATAVLLTASIAHANVISNGFQNFNPTPDGLDFVTVQSSQTLKPGIFNIGLFLNEAINSLPYFEDPTTQTHTNFNDTLLGLDFNIGVGIVKNFELAMSFPSILAQSVSSSDAFHGAYSANGNTEVRVAAKYRIYGDDKGGIALIGTVTVNRTENNPYLGSGAGNIYNYEAAWDTTLNKWRLGVNIGYRHPDSGTKLTDFPIQPIGDQYIASAAGSYLLEKINTKLILEVFGSAPAYHRDSNPDRDASSLEALAGIKHDFTTNLAFHAGMGTQLEKGVSSPDWRWYTGINYTFGPVFSRPTSADSSTDNKTEKIVVGSVLFEFDSDQLAPQFMAFLDDLAARIKKMGSSFKHLQIAGHTDSIGSHEYNMNLSQRRAESIRKYLGSQGVPTSKVEPIGKGEMEPIADNGNFQGRQQNRRVEFTLQKN